MNDDDTHVSPDDVLEETRENPMNAQVGNQPLTEDNDSPADEADATLDPGDEIDLPRDDTHPSTDTDIDPAERYDQGL